jgi:arylesterase/paraoxonase
MPNDVAPTGARRFYITNALGSRSGIGRRWEILFARPRSYVVYFDGTQFNIAARGRRFANGINLSLDGRFVFVAATRGEELLVILNSMLRSNAPCSPRAAPAES